MGPTSGRWVVPCLGGGLGGRSWGRVLPFFVTEMWILQAVGGSHGEHSWRDLVCGLDGEI